MHLNDMRVSKWWQNIHFWLNYSFKRASPEPKIHVSLAKRKTDSRLLTPSTVSKWQSAAVKALCSLHFRLQHNQSVESSRTRPFPRAAIQRTRLYIIPAVWEEHYTLLEALTLNISLPATSHRVCNASELTEYANNYSYLKHAKH